MPIEPASEMRHEGADEASPAAPAVAPAAAPSPVSRLAGAKAFFLPKLHQMAHFVMKQGLAMGGNLVYGFLCVRLLPVSEYAKFAVLFGFMGTLTVLLDLATVGTLAPLVGERIDDLKLIADYVASSRRIALRMYFLVAPIAGAIFLLLVMRQHWGWPVVAQMVGVLLLTGWFARVSSSYGAVLILRRDRNRYYQIQMMGSLGSLALLAALWAMHALNIYGAILLNVAQILFIATCNFYRARKLLGTAGVVTGPLQRSIVRLAAPNIPGTLFYAVQGQITLMLITVFGHSSTSVASVGALNRLGQVFVLFSQMNPVLVEPFFARLPASRLKPAYLAAVLIVGVCLALFSASAFLFPDVFLWILGPNYRQLRFEAGLVVMGSSIQFMAGFLFMIHTARRFVYWWSNIANIVLILAVQIVFIWKLDLSTVRNVLKLTVASSVVSLVVVIACGLYGFWFGPQKLEEEQPAA